MSQEGFRDTASGPHAAAQSCWAPEPGTKYERGRSAPDFISSSQGKWTSCWVLHSGGIWQLCSEALLIYYVLSSLALSHCMGRITSHTWKTGLKVVDETLQESQGGFKRDIERDRLSMAQSRTRLVGSREFSLLPPAQGLSLYPTSQRHLFPCFLRLKIGLHSEFYHLYETKFIMFSERQLHSLTLQGLF